MRQPEKPAAVLADLDALPAAKLASDTDVLKLIEGRGLWGRGLAGSTCISSPRPCFPIAGFGRSIRNWNVQPADIGL
ncbi:MAG: hypothetical protein ACRD4O_18705 [Bryobacteraceae bacterium]